MKCQIFPLRLCFLAALKKTLLFFSSPNILIIHSMPVRALPSNRSVKPALAQVLTASAGLRSAR